MKVALIVPGGVDRSGRERVIPVLLALIERLAWHHQVVVIALDQEPEPSRYSLLGATVVNLGRGFRAGRGVRWAARLKGLTAALREEGGHFDVLHALGARGPGSLAVAAGRLLHIPVVVSLGGGELVWLREIDFGGQGSWLRKLEAALVLRHAKAVSGGSHYSLRPLAQRRPDAIWLPWGVDVGRFDAPVERPAGPPWRLLHVASINRVKDQATLLRAMRLVLDRQPDDQLDCVGEDTLGGKLQRSAVELGLENAVRFHGFKPQDALVPFYHRAHLYVQSSLHESMGATVVEAGAAGVPTVGTAVGLVPELAPSAALAVPVADAAALAEGILTVLADPARRERLGRSAQAFARTYSADWTVSQFEAIYARLSETGRRS